MASSLAVLLLNASVIAAFILYYRRKNSKKNVPYPPGPPPDPLIGHTRLIPGENQAELFHEWGKKYGDVIYLNVLGKPIVVLNSVQAALDLMDKRSANYSDRPRFTMYVDILETFPALAFLEYGKRFQKHRKLFNVLSTRAQCRDFESIQLSEARFLMKGLLTAPADWEWHIRRYGTAIITKIAYGHEVLSNGDGYIKIAEGYSKALENSGSPGATPPDLFPVLRHLPPWFPGAWWSRYGRDWKHAVRNMYDVPFNKVRENLANGTAQPSFVATQLEELAQVKSHTEEDIEDIKGAGFAMYAGGAETTWSSIKIFMLAMTLYPETQKRAQEEIDAVIGHDRLPEFSDRESIPYVDCLVQEVLRWHPIVPLGLPHRSLEDDIYRGMFIPKGSTILANALSMALDETVYAEPHKFIPERYLPKPDGNAEPHPCGHFGFGRRACPGRFLADNNIWIALASMLASIDITKARTEDGKEIMPELAFTSGAISQPKDFKCVVSPRSEKAVSLVMQATPW